MTVNQGLHEESGEPQRVPAQAETVHAARRFPLTLKYFVTLNS
jgi:hypothetical protein